MATSENKLVSVKWMGPNTPIIALKRNDLRVSMTKGELKALHSEIGNFIDYYKENFSDSRIDNKDEPFEL